MEKEKLSSKYEEKEDKKIIPSSCKNCPKLNKLIDDLYKFMNNLILFMQEQGFQFDNIDFSRKMQSRIDKLSNNLFNEEDHSEDFKNQQINNQEEDSTKIKFKFIEKKNSTEENLKQSNIPREIDINVITRRIDELNMIVIKDNDHANFEYDKTENVYKLVHRKEIKIGFYKNGIAIENFPFFSYDSNESKKILSDILDGYTPYVFKDKYPKGVLLQVINGVNVVYDSNDTYINCENGYIKGLFDIECSKKKKLSKEEFLNKLPGSILKDGKVYNIKDDLSNIISGNEQSLDYSYLRMSDNKKTCIDYSVDRIEEINIFDIEEIKKDFYFDFRDKKQLGTFEEFVKLNIDQDELINNQICKFKISIRLLNDKNLIINVSKKKHLFDIFFELVQLVKNCSKLPKYKIGKEINLENSTEKDFILITTFPRKVYEYDDKKNFEENQLFPTSVFFFEEKKKI